MVANALIVDHQIAALASSQCDDTITRHSNHLDILSLWHTKYLQHEVGDVFWPLDLEDLILLAIQVDLVGILRVAKLARAYLVDRCQGLLLVVIKAAPSEPRLQAL